MPHACQMSEGHAFFSFAAFRFKRLLPHARLRRFGQFPEFLISAPLFLATRAPATAAGNLESETLQ